MIRNQNGETELISDGISYVNEKIKELEETIDKIEAQARLTYVIGGKEIDEILLYSNEQLDKLTPEECDRCSFLCLQYVIELQKKINRSKTIKGWAWKNIDVIIGQEYNNYHSPKDYCPADVIKNKIIADNSYAKKLFSVAQEQDITIDILYDMTKHVTQMSLVLKNMGYNKKVENVSYREN